MISMLAASRAQYKPLGSALTAPCPYFRMGKPLLDNITVREESGEPILPPTVQIVLFFHTRFWPTL